MKGQYIIEKAWRKYGPQMRDLGIQKKEIAVETERDGKHRVFADGRQFGEISWNPAASLQTGGLKNGRKIDSKRSV